MNRAIWLPACAATLLWMVAGCSTSAPPGPFDVRDVRGYRHRVQGSSHPDAVRLRARLNGATARLLNARAAAQRAGIPLNAAQMPRWAGPQSRNAAPLYLQAAAALRKAAPALRPGQFTPTQTVYDSLGAGHAFTRAQLIQARGELAARGQALALILQATDRPECHFSRNWGLGAGVLFPEFSQFRAAARLLRSKAYLLAADGRFDEAIAIQERGFRLADHVTTEPVLIAYLVAIAVDAITLRGLEDILMRAGPNAAVANRIRQSILSRYRTLDLAHAMTGEALFLTIGLAQLRAGKPTDIDALIPGRVEEDAPPPPDEISREDQAFVLQIADATEAEALDLLMKRLKAARAPYPERLAALKSTNLPDDPTAEGKVDQRDPITRLVEIFAFSGYQAAVAEAKSQAQAAALIAAADVMAYRARTGRFPDRLDQALTAPARDPFTGRPLRYRREPKGFVVYSTGQDGKFDGGKPGSERDGRQAYVRYPPAPPKPFGEQR